MGTRECVWTLSQDKIKARTVYWGVALVLPLQALYHNTRCCKDRKVARLLAVCARCGNPKGHRSRRAANQGVSARAQRNHLCHSHSVSHLMQICWVSTCQTGVGCGWVMHRQRACAPFKQLRGAQGGNRNL
eukprot:5738332-Prymnesium_polylepis.1